MGNVINFKQAGKKAAKIKKEKQTRENRAKYGQKKSVKTRTRKEKNRIITHLDDHKVTDPDDKGEG